jgi:hypothetical protein
MLRKFGIIAVLSMLVVALAAVPALAAAGPTSGVHFTHGGTPTCTISGSGATATVNCTSELAGLGEGDITSTTTISGFAVYQCQNQGGNIAPGQNKVLEGPVTNPVTIPGSEIKNGRATVPGTATLTAAPTVSAAEAGCPNNNWIGVNPTLTITSVTFSASQGGVLVFTATATNPNGLSGTFPLTVTGGAVL